jgi:hypothetical protein
MSLSDCLHKIRFAAEDAAEIRAAVEKSGDEKKGVKAWLDAQRDDLEDLREQLGKRGFDFELRRAEARPEMRASLRDTPGLGTMTPKGMFTEEEMAFGYDWRNPPAPRPQAPRREAPAVVPKEPEAPVERPAPRAEPRAEAPEAPKTERPILTTRTPAQPVERVRWVRPEEDAKTPRSTVAARMAPIQGTGKTRVRGVAARMNERYVEDGNIEGLGEMPTYEQLSMADQTKQALEIVKSDPQRAYDIAMGDKAPPKGVLAEMFHMAVEEEARANGDVETLRDLATKSKLVPEATDAGRRIRAWGERDRTSPAAALQEIHKARLAEYNKTGRSAKDAAAETAAVVSDIKKEIKKKAPTKDQWADLIAEITCGA